MVDRIIKDFGIINECAKKIGVSIYNTTKQSRLSEVFEYKELKDVSGVEI
jgi:hypothetical protein